MDRLTKMKMLEIEERNMIRSKYTNNFTGLFVLKNEETRGQDISFRDGVVKYPYFLFFENCRRKDFLSKVWKTCCEKEVIPYVIVQTFRRFYRVEWSIPSDLFEKYSRVAKEISQRIEDTLFLIFDADGKIPDHAAEAITGSNAPCRGIHTLHCVITIQDKEKALSAARNISHILNVYRNNFLKA
jgi:hypothetical protein